VETGVSVGARIVTIVIHAVTGVFVARAVGPSGKGVVTLVATVMVYVSTTAGLGVDVAIVHYGGREVGAARRIAAAALRLSALLAPIAALAGALVVLALRNGIPPGVRAYAVAVAVASPLALLASYLQGLLVATGRIVEVGIVTATKAVVWAVLVLGCLASGAGVAAILLAFLAAEVFALGLWVLLVVRAGLWPRRAERDRAEARRLVRYGLSGHLGTVLQGVNYRLDVIILAARLDASAVGLYSVGVTLAEQLLFVPLVLSLVLANRAASEAPADAAEKTALATRLTSGTTIVGGALVALLGPFLVPAVFGHEFRASVRPMWVLLPGVWALGIYINLMNDLGGRGHPRIKSLTAACGVLVTVVLNLVLVPRLGIVGAAWASTASYVVLLATAIVPFGRITGIGPAALLVPRRRDVRTVVMATKEVRWRR
jgi:O-antigen/teichoic acid export membrane protein